MRVITVVGYTKTGKTTTIEKLITELKHRGYSVGSVKDIHFAGFKADVEGTNTDRHRKAGADMVTGRGHFESVVYYSERVMIPDILKQYHHDYVILEGVNDFDVPSVVTADCIEGIEGRMRKGTFAIAGKISAELTEYKGLPVINALTDVRRLCDMVEQKAREVNVNEKNGLLRGEEIKEFISKKNAVYLIEIDLLGEKRRMVLKKGADARKEGAKLRELAGLGVKVPEIYGSYGDVLLLEYMGEKTVYDALAQTEELNETPDLILKALISWLSDYYKAAEKLYGKDASRADVNLRNFILMFDGSVAGVDFEEDVPHNGIAHDIGIIAAYMLTYDPILTVWKKNAAHLFLKEWGGGNEIKQSLKEGLENIKTRRGIDIDPGKISDEIMK